MNGRDPWVRSLGVFTEARKLAHQASVRLTVWKGKTVQLEVKVIEEGRQQILKDPATPTGLIVAVVFSATSDMRAYESMYGCYGLCCSLGGWL